jgi:hypothetical protein
MYPFSQAVVAVQVLLDPSRCVAKTNQRADLGTKKYFLTCRCWLYISALTYLVRVQWDEACWRTLTLRYLSSRKRHVQTLLASYLDGTTREHKTSG